MNGFLKFLIILIIVLVVAFVVWFVALIKNGQCPICILQKKTKPTKVTLDTEKYETYENNAPKIPIMGWSSWNTFRNEIDEKLILETALAMKESKLLDFGYNYLNLDDCWQSSLRDDLGNMQGDLGKFPTGIKNLVSKINSLGIKVGIYSSNGTLTCEDLPASLGREEKDAKTFASWGCELLKYDFCHSKPISGKAPLIKSIEISPLGKNAEVTLFPENADYDGKAKSITIGKNGEKAIGMINHGAGTATFRPSVASSGEYALTIIIKKTFSKEQYLQISVNGKIYEMSFAKMRGYSSSGRRQIIVKLESGVNEIKIYNPIASRADSSFIQYHRMGQALKKASKEVANENQTEVKPITFSICEWGLAYPWKWGEKAGNMWRTTPDISPRWSKIHWIYKRTVGLYKNASPAHFNDPDMLEVGNGKLTEDENRTHFSLWCMMAAPLILGNDIRKFANPENNKTFEIVTNKNLIAVDQDPLAKPAKKFKSLHGIDILARPLADGDIALCFYNKTKSPKGLSFDIEDIIADEYLNFSHNKNLFSITDLWSNEQFSAKTISASIQKHSVKVYKISSK